MVNAETNYHGQKRGYSFELPVEAMSATASKVIKSAAEKLCLQHNTVVHMTSTRNTVYCIHVH